MMSQRLVLFKYQQQFRLNICPVVSITHSHWENWFVLVALKITTNLLDLYSRETRARHQMQFVFGAVWWMKPAATWWASDYQQSSRSFFKLVDRIDVKTSSKLDWSRRWCELEFLEESPRICRTFWFLHFCSELLVESVKLLLQKIF